MIRIILEGSDKQSSKDSKPCPSLPKKTDDVQKMLETLSVDDNKPPVFLSHSKDDEILPFHYGLGLCDTLKNLGFDVTWRGYEDGGHWIHAKSGVDDISKFLGPIIDKGHPL